MVTNTFSGKFKMPRLTTSLMVFCSVMILEFHVTSVSSHPTHGNLKVLQYHQIDGDTNQKTIKQDEAARVNNGTSLCVSCETTGGTGTGQVGHSETIAGGNDGKHTGSMDAPLRNRRWGGCGFKGIGC